MTTYTIKGINDEEDTCSCCGKTGLKRVVWLAAVSVDGEESEPMPLGTSCAAKKMFGKSSGKASDENKLTAAMSAAVKAKCHQLLNSFVAFGSNCVPAELIEMAKVDLFAAMTERNNRFPILNWMNGTITTQQAAKYL